ncbi:Ribosomal RNA small subunit methyltransferase A [Fundidesulfovibrio magnetotacticus]|uniref:Ribosomal RNA small subunit methyltransferase A n=1 Tax=Fundidesulfovibrio magnetotacticus TaxID=2730080 RepID=A0A6V8LMP1_9BACT|nr:16S rRNA (adenine(1518)-N(6)/adenine(1519)-N(6))-dimethyltransferase RsmA [Fundidesulfovibrio magnetotacticus]GFK92260.1 Ribosomal RNA small subunit methyltransferase A [Fundidesulfovibrio magnetotacticus]
MRPRKEKTAQGVRGGAASGSFGGRPKKSLGQNFLTDPNVARRIVASLGVEPGDAVLEIGPGRGALTGFLMVSGAGRVMALEKDRDLAPELPLRFPGLCVVNADAMRFAWDRLDRLPRVRVVGNLPYNVASPIMWDLAWLAQRFARAVFMVQLEVAERIVAVPRTGDYGGLSVWLQSFVTPAKLFKVGPNVFTPRPKVDSAVVAFTPRPVSERPREPGRLARFIKRIFSMRRKQLGRILGADLTPGAGDFLESQGLSPRCRPEELTPGQILLLMNAMGDA